MDQSEAVLACVDELIGLYNPAQLPMALAAPLHELIPYDFLVYNEIDTATGTILTVSNPAGVETRNAAFEEFAYQHPLLTHYQRTRDPNVLRMSDYITQTEFHQLELYNEFLRQFGIEHQIVCTVPAVRTVAIGLVLTRERQDFSDSECETLAMLRPHVLRAYRAARTRAKAQSRLDMLEDSIASSGRGVLLLDASNEVITASPGAERLLLTYGAGPAASLSLRIGERESTTITRGDGRLLITRVGSALLLDETLDPLGQMRLRALGLSAREADVLQSVGDGASNKAIAERLGITLRTVKKHLERIYEKLGVDSRTAAIARARSARG